MSLIVAFALLLTTANETPLPWCSPSPMGELVVADFKNIADAEGAEADMNRRLHDLPKVPRDSVVQIKDERVCERAARAYYRFHLGPTPPGGVFVLRIANRYVVYGATRAGEWTIVSIFSPQFEPIVNIAR
jgi:hypothetical protein